MPITNEQRERRRNFLGASDIPAILGVNPWQSAYDIFLSKTQKLDEAANDAMEIGTRLEPAITDWAEDQLGPLNRDVEIIDKNLPFLMVHLDAQVVEDKSPVEVKTAGLLSMLTEFRTDDGIQYGWGEPGTDQIPDYVSTQAYGQMYVTGTEICHIPAFLGGRGFNLYRVNRNEEVMKMILEACTCFWQEHVLKGIPPADSAPSLELVKRIKADETAEAVDLPDDLMESYLAAKEAEKAATEHAEQLEAMAKAAFGSAVLGRTSTREFSCKEQHRKSFVMPECHFRVLRLLKPKK